MNPVLFPERPHWPEEAAALRRTLRAIARRAPAPALRPPLAAFLCSGKLIRAQLYLAHTHPAVPNRIPTAAGIELLHAASLIHDDIIDGDPTRRQQPACWRTHGIPTALLLGDWLLTQAIAHLPLNQQLTTLVTQMTQAELRQLVTPAAPGSPAYRRYITDKTARLFEYAARLAAPRRTALHRAALAFGIAFQLADDHADSHHTPCVNTCET